MTKHKLFSTDQWFQIAPVQYGLFIFLGSIGAIHIADDLDLLTSTGLFLDNGAYGIAIVGTIASCVGARYRLGRKSGRG